MLYMDTSAILKLFVQEDHTSLVQTSVGEAGSRVVTSDLAYVETISALQRHLKVKKEIDFAITQFMEFWSSMITVPMDKAFLIRAGIFARTYGLRGADAIHLAAAVQEKRKGAAFIVFDKELAEAAGREGFRVIC